MNPETKKTGAEKYLQEKGQVVPIYTYSHVVAFMDDFAKQDKETSINFLIHMLKKYEGHDIIERWQMEDDFEEWINQKQDENDKHIK